jgi:uncharacterized protein involved in type VI secretion and phage assembly
VNVDEGYHAEVEVNDSKLSSEWTARLLRVVVDDNLQFPTMFELAFVDPDNEGIDGSGLAIGGSVKITAESDGGSVTLLSGEVTALEGEYDKLGSVLVARGYDKAHRLHHGRKTRAWLNKSDSDIVSEVAGGVGVPTGTIDSTSVEHSYLVQAGLTDWEFLRSRARAIGYDLTMTDGKLDFRAPVAPADAPAKGSYGRIAERQLLLGLNLHAFRPRVTAAEQVTSVEARGWDPAKKEVVTATAEAATKTASLGKNTPSDLAGTAGGGAYVAVTEPHASVDDAQNAADAIAERIGSASIEAEGSAIGSPHLRAGTAVNIGEVGPTFDGKYVLSATRHVFDADGYLTHFVISGRQERSLLGLSSGGATNEELNVLAPLQGVVVGLVTDVGDEKNQGRVKVKLPALSDSYSTDWIRVAYVGAGSKRGLFVVPEVNDEVLVAFAHGDPRQPVVVGSLYNGTDEPKDAAAAVADGKVLKRVLTSRLGHSIELRDDDSDSGLKLETASGEKIDLRAGDKKITITSGGDVVIDGTGDVKISATKGLTLSAGTELKLSAPTIKINGDGTTELSSAGQLTVKGTNTQVQGEATVTVSSNAVCTIQSALVRIN